MFERAIERYRGINKKLPPENSVLARAAVLATVLVATAAIISMGYFPVSTNILAPAGIVAGFLISWRVRDKPNIGLKAVLSLALLGVTGWFFFIMAVEPYDTRVPLAELFLWIQVLHSFDVPARRDLMFSLVAALVQISMACTLAMDLSFTVYIAVFAASALFALFALHISENGISPGDVRRDVSPRGFLKTALAATVLILAVSAIAYIATPRFPGLKVQTLPFSAERAVQAAFRGSLMGGSEVDFGERLPMSRATFSGKAYPGFNEALDLRVRGRLSRDLMMRVKSTDPVYHRGMVFDTYTRLGWTATDDKPRRVSQPRNRPPIILPNLDVAGAMGARETTSSYYIQSDQPNIVFAPYQASLLYFPSAAVWQDKGSALTSSFSLDSGVVYSVVSRYDPPDPERLRKVPGTYKVGDFSEYLALPVVPARLRKFAVSAAGDSDKPYARLESIQDILRRRCVYDLEAPFQKQEQDAVDFFLFESRAGGCDQFASAFVVMARLNGIPARLITGYAPGDYNPFTGYWEVRAEHAHAWAEAYMPNYGWIAFDPTPGAEMEIAGQRRRTAFVFGGISDYLKTRFSGGIKKMRDFYAAFRSVASGPAGKAGLLIAIICALAVAAARLKRIVGRPSKQARSIPMGVVENAYHDMLRLLGNAGRPRPPGRTPAEYAADLPEFAELETMTRLFEEEFYGGKPTAPDRADSVPGLVAALAERLKRLG